MVQIDALNPGRVDLEGRIEARTARVAVLGLGYVGLPLAVAMARAGFAVVGIDPDEKKIETLRSGASYALDVESSEIARLAASQSFCASGSYEDLADADAVIISVPTPMTRMKQPDISCILAAGEGLAAHLRPGMLVVLQSTTFPGTTERYLRPVLERSGLCAGVDFHLAYVPERINPGDTRFTVENIPTVAGGLTGVCGELAASLFRAIGAPVTVTSSPSAAELTKCYENSFRFVNIALANEIGRLCERMGLNAWEVIDAASTKPFGFLAHYPSGGVGGHCILVDPYYLACAAREYDLSLGFIQLAASVNEAMPYHVADLVRSALGRQGMGIQGAKVLVLGVAFKKDIDDARNSPAERLIETLLDDGAEVVYHDPFVPEFPAHSDFVSRRPFRLHSVPLDDELLTAVDCAVIMQAHSGIDYHHVVTKARSAVDACGALPVDLGTGVPESVSARIVRLGVG